MLQHLLLVFLLSILDPRAAHFQSCHCLRLMIYYPCVHSFGPYFIIFPKHGNMSVGLHFLALVECFLTALGNTKMEHCQLALDLVEAQKITPSRLS